MPLEILKKVYKPTLTVGQVYAKPYGSTAPLTAIGNVLELSLEHSEDVKKQDDMTQLGGGTYAEVRRVNEVKIKMKISDLNVVNLARATLGTMSGIEAGTVEGEEFTVSALGVLLPLLHIAPTSVVVKKGATKQDAQAVAMEGNYVVKPEGIVLLSGAPGLTADDKLWVDYSYGEYACVEALTTKAPELQFLFGGLNEGADGDPVIVDIWRASQGVTKALTLINKDFGALDVEGTVLKDPSKSGTGISQYYRTRMA